jgi:hypothetical protein
MVATLQKAEPTAANEPLVSEAFSREASMIADHAYGRILQRHDPSGRRLRNRIIMANAIAWIVVIALICLTFF